MMKTSIALFGCLAFSTVFAANAAQQVPQSTIVRYRAADLSTPAQAQALYRRIKFAARTVCPGFMAPDLEHTLIMRACIENAVANAVDDVNHPALTKLHEGVVRVRLASRHGYQG